MLPACVAVGLGRDRTDDDLLARLLAGDLRFFEALMRRHNQRVYRAARAVVLDDREAEDVMQDAYVHAYATLTRFDRRTCFAVWIARVAVDEAAGRARKVRLKSHARGFDPRRSGVRRLDTSPHARRLGALTAAVDGLPDGLRRAFVLREVEQLSGSETARILGMSEDAVRAQVHRAHRLIQAALPDDRADPRALYVVDAEAADRVVRGALERLATRFADSALALAEAS